jgi:hypothetical protein
MGLNPSDIVLYYMYMIMRDTVRGRKKEVLFVPKKDGISDIIHNTLVSKTVSSSKWKHIVNNKM